MSSIAAADLASHGPLRRGTTVSPRLLCGLFFVSGCPALIYQLLWQRALFRIFGVNSESVTIVVTAFMIGLGAGSLAGGWLSRFKRLPLLPLLAAIEIGTAVFGVFSLAIFDRVGALAAGAPLPLTAAINLALVSVPTLLMGATLPLLVAHLVRVQGDDVHGDGAPGQVGDAVARLYYANTLGAACACLLSSVLLFPFLGMQRSIYVAVAINLAVALFALILHRAQQGEAMTPSRAVPRGPRASLLPLSIVLPLAAAGGFISLSYEIFFFRLMSFASGSKAPAFAVTLGVLLAGLASGARVLAEGQAANPQALRRFVTRLIVAGGVAAALLPCISHLSSLGIAIQAIILCVVFVVARAWGGLLPLLAELGVAADDEAGLHSSLVYVANIVGAATGSVLTGFILVDYFGTVALSVLLAIVSLACVAILAAILPLRPRQRRVHLVGAALGAVAVALSVPPASKTAIQVLQRTIAPDFGAMAAEIETRSGLITVDDAGAVYGNGAYDGRLSTSLVHDTNMVVRPYALSLFHAAPRDVLMIGLSSGSWAQVIASNPDVRSLTVIEINPGYVQLIAGQPTVASILRNPKVTIVADDGRRWLRLHPDRTFDAIVSNTTWHFRANVTNLLSTEFLDLAKRHLAPHGILFYNTTESARVQRTACLAYPHGARFTNHMVVSREPMAWDFDRWRRVLTAYSIDGARVLDLTRSGDRDKLDGLMDMRGTPSTSSSSIESCVSILGRTEKLDAITDDNMGEEWRQPLGLD